MNEYQRLALGLGILFIIAGGFGLYLSWPLITGTDIVLDTRPIDPFDPIRGQYIVIAYDIGAIPALPTAAVGDTVYVKLVENGTVWSYAGASKEKPQGVFIRGTVENNNGQTMRVRYGIEQFFFERNADVPTVNVTVHVKVSSNGGSRIVKLLQNNKPVDVKYEPVTINS
jgi:uncharacterized membrane-anchored protein